MNFQPLVRVMATLVIVPAALAQPADLAFAHDNGGITLPEGFRAVVVADNLGPARHLAVRDNGDIYVALRKPGDGGGIVALRDVDADGKADEIRRFGKEGGTGIRIHKEHLYFATVSSVLRYRLKPDDLLSDATPEIIATGFPEQRQHADKPVVFDNEDGLYVNVGAPSNNCQVRDRRPGSPGVDPCPELERYAGIWRFNDEKIGQTQEKSEHFATGIRQCIAMAWSSKANALYAVQHGRDQLHSLWPNLFTVEQGAELPAEEFLLVKRGSNFGWPYGYWDHLQGKRVLAPEYGGDGKEAGRCDQYDKPILAFPGHWAPNDLMFYVGSQFPEKYRDGAFIAFHGSWDRAPLPQGGFKVVFVPFRDNLPSGDWETFADGFAGKEVVRSISDARFRPMGLAQGPEGSLYISDSQAGRIWRVVWVGENP